MTALAPSPPKVVITQTVQHGPLDVAAPEHLEVMVSPDGKSVWINVNGVCWFRATRIGELQVTDGRSGPR